MEPALRTFITAMAEATVLKRIGVIWHDRVAKLPELASQLATAPHYDDGTLFHVASSLKWRSLASSLYLDRVLRRSESARLKAFNRWAAARFDNGRFLGDRFVLEMPPEFPNASQVVLNDLREIYLENRYATLFPFGRFIEANDVVIDCGANIGAFAIYAATRALNVTVLAFEPETVTYQALVRNVVANGLSDQIRCLPSGVGEHVTNLGILRRSDCFTMHGLQESGADESVQCTTIDECRLDRCDLIKMDVEGFEVPALKGSRATLQRFRPKLTVAAYHRPTDPWVLSRLVKDICPSYNVLVSGDAHLYAFP